MPTGFMELFQHKNVWKLVSLDDGSVIEGQYVPTDLTENVGSKWSMIGTHARDQPIIQYDGQESETITFGAKCWAHHQGILGLLQDEIEAQVRKIKKLCQRDPDLNRPHIYEFSVGQSVSMTCVVETVGGIVYDRLRPLDGTLRGVQFKLTLRRYVPYDSNLKSSGAESLIVNAKNGDTYEALAVAVYGAATLGEAIRRRNPRKPFPKAGDQIHFPPKTKVSEQFVRDPQLGMLRNVDVNRARFLEQLALRGKPKLIRSFTRDWESV